MADYEVCFAASAAKEFRSLPVDIKLRVGMAIEKIRQAPRSAGVRKLYGQEQLYRIRVGQYRIVYEIDDQANLIRVTRVRHRREAYR